MTVTQITLKVHENVRRPKTISDLNTDPNLITKRGGKLEDFSLCHLMHVAQSSLKKKIP